METFNGGNLLIPYKDRVVNLKKPVMVYRNLNAKKDMEKYSVLQKGLVVAHTNQLMLHDCTFIVRKKGQEKVRKTGCKNVHAFIEGYISLQGGMGTTAKDSLQCKISYNPFKNNTFMCNNIAKYPVPVYEAMVVIINKNGVSGAYID